MGNHLKLNTAKAEITTCRQWKKHQPTALGPRELEASPQTSREVRIVGINLGSNLSLLPHVNNVTKSTSYTLKTLHPIFPHLDTNKNYKLSSHSLPPSLTLQTAYTLAHQIHYTQNTSNLKWCCKTPSLLSPKRMHESNSTITPLATYCKKGNVQGI